MGFALCKSWCAELELTRLCLRSQPTLLGDTLSAILATLVGAGALVLAGHILAASDADNFKIVGGVVGSSIPLSGLWFFASGGSGAKKKSR